jgi:hypothetical protein
VPFTLLLLLFLAAAGMLPAAVAYLRREPSVPGRNLLLGVRLAALLLLALLLLNPGIPGRGEAPGPGGGEWVLMDWTRALDVPAPDGGTLRERVTERARERARAGARLAFLGPEPEGIDTLALPGAAPRLAHADLRTSLLRLAEAGADSILLLSPLRLTPAELERALEEVPVPVRIEQVGRPVLNAGVLELALPRRTPAGEPVEGSLVLFGEGGGVEDTVLVVVEADGEEVYRETATLPQAGSRTRIPLRLPQPPDSGWVRYQAAVRVDGDVFPSDDVRSRRVRVGPPEGGVVLLSLLPDWEPRVLLPVLESATGLEGEGYLRLAEDHWIALGAGGDDPGPVSPSTFVPRVGAAGLLVVHGVGEEVPGWLAEAAGSHPRVLHLPAGRAGAELAALSRAGTRGGEWIPSADVPASPVAPFVSGLPLTGLPPLSRLRAPGAEGGVPVLLVRSTPGGEALPALILRDGPDGRRAVALAEGFWRWAHRTGPPREAYRGLWAGVAGWLLGSEGGPGEGAIRPVDLVVGRDERIAWMAPGGSGRRLDLRFRPWEERSAHPDGEPTETRAARLDQAGRGTADPLPPGRWWWRGEVIPGTADEPPLREEAESGEGEIEVEPWTGVLATPPLTEPPLVSGPGVEVATSNRVQRGSRPLRTHPAPYLALLLLLCGEWIGRRRVGLR